MFLNLGRTHSQNTEYLISTHMQGHLGKIDRKKLQLTCDLDADVKNLEHLEVDVRVKLSSAGFKRSLK